MKILLVQDDCSIGGHTFLRLENAKGLVRHGHEVVCYFFNNYGGLEDFEAVCPVVLDDEAAFVRLLAADGFDIVHGDASMIDLPRLLRAARFRGRLVLTRHAVDSPVGWLAQNVDAYVAESASSAALMQPYTDLPVQIVPNGIDVEYFSPVPCQTPSRPVIAWCGRSRAAFKNIDLYLRVTRLLDPTQYKFWIADGDAGDCAPGFIPDDCSHVESWRRYDRTEFPLFYSRIAASGGCLLGTSLSEGLPLTLLEALSCGCPVVAMNSRGVNDVMTGPLRNYLFDGSLPDSEVVAIVNGSLPFRKGLGVGPDSLCSRVTKPAEGHLAMPFIGVDLGVGSLRRHVVENFSTDVMVLGNLNQYRRVLERPRSRGRVGGRRPNRRQIAENLWRSAVKTLGDGGRLRDALFAMRAAVRLQPSSVLQRDRLRIMMIAANVSRLSGARACLGRAESAVRKRDVAAGIREIIHAIRIHPGVVLSPAARR